MYSADDIVDVIVDATNRINFMGYNHSESGYGYRNASIQYLAEDLISENRDIMDALYNDHSLMEEVIGMLEWDNYHSSVYAIYLAFNTPEIHEYIEEMNRLNQENGWNIPEMRLLPQYQIYY